MADRIVDNWLLLAQYDLATADAMLQTKRIEITARLFHWAFQVDPAIEPKCIFSDGYENPDRASILAEIIGTSVEIV